MMSVEVKLLNLPKFRKSAVGLVNESFVLPEGSWNNCVLEPWKFIWDVPYVDSPKAFSLGQFFTQTCLSTS